MLLNLFHDNLVFLSINTHFIYNGHFSQFSNISILVDSNTVIMFGLLELCKEIVETHFHP